MYIFILYYNIFLDNKSITENSIGSHAVVQLLRKYVTMHVPQNVKNELCNSHCRESKNLLLTYRFTFYYIFRNIFG